MSVKATAASASERWQQNFAASGQRYIEGINAVKVAPGQLAANQKAAYVNRVAEMANYWAARVAGVSLQSWQAASTGVGAQRLATGATKGGPKMAAFMQKFLPTLSNIVDGLQPRGTYDQNVARLNSYIAALHAQKGQF